jgi:futalosine hydrolase
MDILLAAATSFEIQPTTDFLRAGSLDRLSVSLPCPTTTLPLLGSAAPSRVLPLITGVGSTATTWSLMRQIDRHPPDLVIQAGIAGCFTGRPPGEVLVVEEEVLADLGVWEDHRFKTLFDLKLTDPDTPPFSAGRLINPYRKLLYLTALEPVRSATVNEITTDPDRIRWHQQNTAAVVEGMEGGALHYVCLQEKIAFLQLRSVSNDIGVRDKTKWDIRSAIRRLNEELIRLLQQLAQQDNSILEPTNQSQ